MIFVSSMILKRLVLLIFNQVLSQKCRNGVLKKEGLFRIYALLSVHTCDQNTIRYRGVAQTEALIYTIERANLFFKKPMIGYTIYDVDDYENMDYLVNATLDITLSSVERLSSFNDSTTSTLSKSNKFESTTLGLVGLVTSANAKYAHHTFSYINLPVISYSATSDELSNKDLYPNFYRTVPPDVFQVTLISNLLKFFNWTYVSIVASDDSYGRSGALQLSRKLGEDGICVHSKSVITDQNKKIDLIINLNSNPKIKVIVYWGNFISLKLLLSKSKKCKLYGKVWILSEGVGLENWLIEFIKTFQGKIIMINPHTYIEENFKEHFLNLTYNKSSPWLQKLFKQTNPLKTELVMRNFGELFDYRRVGYLQTSVNALIYAFIKYTESICSKEPCLKAIVSIKNRKKFNNILRNANFLYKFNETFTFDNNQDPTTASYDLYVVTDLGFKHSASWTSTKGFTITNYTHLESFQISSSCSKPCPPGQYSVFKYNGFWACVLCPENYVKSSSGDAKCIPCNITENFISNSNRTKCVRLNHIYWNLSIYTSHMLASLFFSVTGAAITIAFMLTFFLKRNTPAVRSSNFYLSMVQMTFHFSLFSLIFLVIGKESYWKCISTTFISGILYFGIITLIWLKVRRLVAIFGTIQKMRKRDIKRIRFTEFLIFLTSNLFHILLMLVINIIQPLRVIQIVNKDELTLHKLCKSETYMIAHIGCVLLLIFFCAIEMFRGRNVPWKYNETKVIAFGIFSSILVKIIAVPLGFSISEGNNYKLMLCIAVNISNLILLISSYISKIRTIWFQSKKNNWADFRTGFRKNMNSDCSLSSLSANKKI
ncbi:metabotropic glutamate receptor 1 [Hydra vulgaris]|uniref:metabotropic glutamate receptor 1 n=1 Tax=Hydra vulgaris TaxID=6087 RepID=UPI001F5FBC8F|nr:metabotropic glutamate receptor 1-like [Hydra vulgaris]